MEDIADLTGNPDLKNGGHVFDMTDSLDTADGAERLVTVVRSPDWTPTSLLEGVPMLVPASRGTGTTAHPHSQCGSPQPSPVQCPGPWAYHSSSWHPPPARPQARTGLQLRSQHSKR